MEVKVEKEKNTELIKKKDVKDSPFTLITTKEGSFIALGNYQITNYYKSQKEALNTIEKITWNRVTQLISLLIEIDKKQNVK